ncbi:UPP1 isoform 11 [Pongo abelii]|uniref:UPP1 isoform 11 n=1 Tax=Pongo abelii TaxID=9601 RepID=A0A2J8U2N2_PONAB|nr:UPP1 isoform 4 [Pongo abelii]PNJ39526.1 UPP1 isoform 8 [Pongo abelii]PNJ39528.1 UPP1 isoform 11 [Pongo abelii]
MAATGANAEKPESHKSGARHCGHNRAGSGYLLQGRV